MEVSRETLARTDLPLLMKMAEEMPEWDGVPPSASGPQQESRIPWKTWVPTSPNDNDQANIDYNFD